MKKTGFLEKITTNPAGFLQNAGNDRKRGRRRSGSVVSHKKTSLYKKNLEEISFINSPEILDFPKIFVIIKNICNSKGKIQVERNREMKEKIHALTEEMLEQFFKDYQKKKESKKSNSIRS